GIFDDIEGTLGLVTAFKIAGAKTVIASLSKVDDDAASEMMSEFYNRMAGKESMHNAFVNAINHMKKMYPHTPKKWTA
ncbi:MAG: CHAT domain-containing protein, partial [Selenomonadaceae bacterium]|nr:CHAT domain-containing protein [Selenomonadaceae bacterium]